MLDGYKRDINYLRVSVTDRCNLRCVYCMPAEGIKTIPHEEILTLEEIFKAVKAASQVGIRKVRLTGGEPLVRLGIVELIKNINSIPQINDIAVTTNGLLLKEMGRELQKAGVKRVNISLDSMDKKRYLSITRTGKLEKVLQGIEEALRLGLNPVKINTVVVRDLNFDEVVDFARWTREAPVHVRFIELMPIGTSSPWAGDQYVPAEEIKSTISSELGPLKEVKKMKGSGPARYFKLGNAKGTIGFITAISDHFCSRCNRLRLTATGGIRPCLFDKREIDIKTPLRRGVSEDILARIFSGAVLLKPDRHHMDYGWNDKRVMSQIGG